MEYNEFVKEWQDDLIARDIPIGSADGKFGENTLKGSRTLLTPIVDVNNVMYVGSGVNIRSEPSSAQGSDTVVGFARSGDQFKTKSSKIEEPYMPIIYNGKQAYAYNSGGHWRWVEEPPIIVGQVYENIQAYIDKFCSGTNTQNILNAMAQQLQKGDNIMEQWALGYLGYKHPWAHYDFFAPRLPYGGRSDLDIEGDCAEIWRDFYRGCFGVDIGSWSVAIWNNYKKTQFKSLEAIKTDIRNEDYSDWKFGDLVIWDFDHDDNYPASHGAGFMRDKQIIQTRSAANPYKIENLKAYAGTMASLKGVVRPMTEAQRAMLIVK